MAPGRRRRQDEPMRPALPAEQCAWVLGAARAGAPVQRHRTAAGLASAVGVHRAQVLRWERGDVRLTSWHAEAYEAACGLAPGSITAAFENIHRDHDPWGTGSVIRDRGPAASGYAEALAGVMGREPSGKELLEASIADSLYRQPSNRLLDARSLAARNGAGGRNFAYLFTWRSPAMGGKLGACHALEIPFVFRHLDAPEAAFLTRGLAPRALGDTMSLAWASFARDGRPQPPAWPEYGAERSTLVLDEDVRVEADPRRGIREFFAAVSPLLPAG